MDNIIFLSAQPDEIYFHWQIEVYLTNFIRLGIKPENIHTLVGITDKPSNEILEIEKKYPSKFYFYKRSNIESSGYSPIIRPDIIYQHFVSNQFLNNKTIFYHDCDIVFTKIPDFSKMLNDNFWYLSDTISYIGANYIKSKGGDKLLSDMCKIVGVDTKLVEENESNSGGAQYLMKNLNANFWKDVLISCVDLWKFLLRKESRDRFLCKNDERFNPIQKWCVDMWCVLWCGLKNGHSVKVDGELSFSWATDSSENWHNHNIYHNAGVTDNLNNTIFNKGDFYNKYPWGYDFSNINRNSNTYNYILELKNVMDYVCVKIFE